MGGWVHLYTYSNNRGTIVPGWGGVPGFILCTKTNEDIAARTMRGPRLKVFTHVRGWVGGKWGCVSEVVD